MYWELTKLTVSVRNFFSFLWIDWEAIEKGSIGMGFYVMRVWRDNEDELGDRERGIIQIWESVEIERGVKEHNNWWMFFQKFKWNLE